MGAVTEGVIVEWRGRWEDVGVISACGVVHVVRVRPLRACRGRPLVGFGSRGGLNHKVHYSLGKMIFHSSPF